MSTVTTGVSATDTSSASSAGSTNDESINIASVNFFTLLGLTEYEVSKSSSSSSTTTSSSNTSNNTSSSSSSSNYGAFLPIIIQNTKTFDDSDYTESTPINEFKITLPWAASEISDSVSVSYSRKFGGETTFSQELIAKVGKVASNAGFSEVAEKLSNWLLANYDSKSLNKTLQLDFVLPIFRVTSGTETNFVIALRMALGTLQGLVYPRWSGFSLPPMVKVTCGGIYQGFKGFVESVRLTYSDTLVQVGDVMLPSVINGSITFKNVFMYTWSERGLTSNAANEFCLAKYPQVLFGLGSSDTAYYYSKGNLNNISYSNSTTVSSEYYVSSSEAAIANYQSQQETKTSSVQSALSTSNTTTTPVTDKTTATSSNSISSALTYTYSSNSSSSVSSYNSWLSSGVTSNSSLFTYGQTMTLTSVASTITKNSLTNSLSNVYVGNTNVGTFLGRYTNQLIGSVTGTGTSTLSGTLTAMAVNSVRDVGGTYYVGGVSIGNILGSLTSTRTTTSS